MSASMGEMQLQNRVDSQLFSEDDHLKICIAVCTHFPLRFLHLSLHAL